MDEIGKVVVSAGWGLKRKQQEPAAVREHDNYDEQQADAKAQGAAAAAAAVLQVGGSKSEAWHATEAALGVLPDNRFRAGIPTGVHKKD